MKPSSPFLQSARLLGQLRECLICKHYSLKTEKYYLYWIRFFILLVEIKYLGMHHPREMGVADVKSFLSIQANERRAL